MRACGVDLRGNDAVFAVIDVADDGTTTFVPTAVRKIPLGDDRISADLKSFQATVKAFLQDQGISHVVIKDRPRSGRMSAGAPTFKMEATFQLIDGLTFEFYWGANIARFRSQNTFEKPEGILAYQEDAYLAAMLHFRKAS